MKPFGMPNRRRYACDGDKGSRAKENRGQVPALFANFKTRGMLCLEHDHESRHDTAALQVEFSNPCGCHSCDYGRYCDEAIECNFEFDDEP